MGAGDGAAAAVSSAGRPTASETVGSAPEKRRRGRPSVAGQRRQQILVAVEVCIIRDGLDATTLERIANECGLHRSNLAHFVGNRDQIIEAALELCVQRFIDSMTGAVAHLPPEDRLPAFIELVLSDSPGRLRDALLLNELYAVAGRNERMRAVLAPAMQHVDEWIAGMVGSRYPDADPACRAAVTATLPLILKELDRTRVLGAPQDHAERAVQVRAAIDLTLATLGPPAGDPA